MLGQQFPDALDAISGKLSDFAGDVATTWNEVGASIKSAADLIKQEEGFRPTAYEWAYGKFDAFRVGFGSDTYVDEMGKVQKVTKDTVVTLEQANADLARRISEFQATIVRPDRAGHVALAQPRTSRRR